MTYSTDIFGNETFVQHTITATDYETTLTVADTTIAPAATSRLEIWRPVTTNAQRVAALVAAKAVANKGCLFAYADGVQYNGVDVPNYCVAAAIAGTRCAYVPHKPLSNVAIPAVITTEQHGYSLSNLKTLGANGIWLVGESEDGVVISRKQVTSAATGDINYDEQSLTTNVDSICIALKNVGKEYVGNSNISPDLITLLQAQMTTTMDSFLISADGKAGPQLLSYEILSLAQDTVNKDRVYCRLSGTPPKPFNEFNIGFYLN